MDSAFWITAKYDGTCRGCGQSMIIGDRVIYHKFDSVELASIIFCTVECVDEYNQERDEDIVVQSVRD